SLAAPEVVVITNAAPAHLEGFGSVEGVARAKGEILAGARRPDFAILNADDDYFEYWTSLCEGSDVVSFGLTAVADVRAGSIKFTGGGSKFKLHTPTGQVSVSLSLHGRHNIL
ncbi:MAG: Mur ligase family protein, partial [Woeseiales bacterium]